MELSPDRALHLREQGRAIRDIQKIEREARRVGRLEEKSAEHWTPGGGRNGLLRQDEVVMAIERDFDSVNARLRNLDDYDTALRSYVEQTGTLGRVRKTLHSDLGFPESRPPL